MSFDTTFDYTATIAAIDGIIATNLAEIAANEMKLMCSNNLVNTNYCAMFNLHYAPECYSFMNNRILNINTYYTQLKIDIQALANLDSGIKATLYNFYIAYPTNLSQLKSKLIYNAVAIASDCAQILSDVTLSNDDKAFLAPYLYNKYQSYTQTSAFRELFTIDNTVITDSL